MKIIIFLLLIVGSFAGFANDGFYQGSGVSIVPVQNNQMKVLSEKLEITPLEFPKCYKVLIPSGVKDKINGGFINDSQLQLGNRFNCPKKPGIGERLVTKFHAKAIYRVQSLQDQTKVQIGFPVPQWVFNSHDNFGDLIGAFAPAVTEFHTFINGKKIRNLHLTQVPTKAISLGDKENAPEKTMAYLWKLDFKKNKIYELITEYDFGVDYSSQYFGSIWFTKGSRGDSKEEYASFFTERIEYFLKPIRLWTGGVPEEIKIRIEAPKGIPIEYLFPHTKGLECIDKRALYYRWVSNYPSEDLAISYPEVGKFKFKKISNQAEYFAWNEIVANMSFREQPKGNYPKINKTCDLMKRILSDQPKESPLHNLVKNKYDPCVKSCW